MGTCPCGSSISYDHCCGVYHSGVQVAPTAELLMRSRYCAYVLEDLAYIRATWHVNHCPEDLNGNVADLESERTRWMGLTIVKAWQGEEENQAYVEFIAKFKVGGQGVQRMHEISRFVREHERWYYVDGVFPRQ